MSSAGPFLVDTTMRDGTQAPGLRLSRDFKTELVRRLNEAGIRDIEAGIPAMGVDERAFLRLLAEGPGRIVTWCRARASDLADSERAGTGAVHIGFPASERLLDAVGWTRRDLMRRIRDLVRAGFIGHAFVSVGFMDCFRADPALLSAAVETAVEGGALRVRLADSIGIGTPERVRVLAALFPEPLLAMMEFHAHNDLGMATANAVQALESGFGGLSGTVGGIGERAGNLCWEQLAVAMAAIDRPIPGLSSRALVSLAIDLHAYIGEPVPPRRPVLGEACRLHESGIHAAAHLKDPLAFLPYRPEDHGLPAASIVAGTTSGRGGLAGMLREAGIEPDTRRLGPLSQEVRKKAEEAGRFLNGEELVRLYNGQIGVPL